MARDTPGPPRHPVIRQIWRASVPPIPLKPISRRQPPENSRLR